MDWRSKANQAFQTATTGGVASRFFGLWQGRCTFFACVFSVVGLYGWLVLNRDLTSFALFAGSIQALLIAHSWKQDVAEQNEIRNQQTVVINTSK
jgi:hypothetical protein